MANNNPPENVAPAVNNLPLAELEYKNAPERLQKAQDRLVEEPYDIEAWGIFIRENQRKKCIDARPFYEKLVAQFPTTAKYWKIYVEHEIRAHNYERVEKIFQRCLVKILHIDLWRCYLSYIKETKASLPTYQEKMAQAYEFAIDKIGQDVGAFHVWLEYITFLKHVEAVGTYAENQRITAVRRVYHRGVTTPVAGVEALWKDYCIYENSISAAIAKKMIDERSKDYSNAKRVSREMDVLCKQLNRNLASLPPRATPDELRQIELWQKLINWEKDNPLRSEDPAIVAKRVMFLYEQFLLCFGHHPDIWYEAAEYLDQASRVVSERGDQNSAKLFADEASNFYERGYTGVLETCLLLYLAHADFEEGRMRYDKAHAIYKRFIALPHVDPSLCYIKYMHFARRAEGIKSARIVFKSAREDSRTTYHVFVAAALMEFYCSKDKNIAYKIFELGLKKYGENTEFILAFIEYMIQLNEDNNTRVLFERVLSSAQLPADKSLEIWKRFVEFETMIGDLPSINKTEKRRLTVFQAIKQQLNESMSETSLLVDRYKYLDLYPCSDRVLRSLGYNKSEGRSGGTGLIAAHRQTDANMDMDAEQDKEFQLPKPDVNQMIPYKPKQFIPTGAHPVPGGVFPPPPAASSLMMLLPPPECFTGPFVMMDDFLKHFSKIQLPDDEPRSSKLINRSLYEAEVLENGEQEAVMDAGTKYSVNQLTIVSKKRKLPTTVAEDRDSGGEEDQKAPVNDLFRLRQQKRVR